MALTDRRPTGLMRWLLRVPILLYRAGLGGLLGPRLAYLVHLGRRSGARYEVVAEVVGHDPAGPEFVVVAAWGGRPDWYRNLLAHSAPEVRLGRQRWIAPEQRLLGPDEVRATLARYQREHPRAWPRLAPLLGFPVDPDDPRWPEVATTVHAIAFRPHGTGQIKAASD